jgi:Flp pilus assembly protein TadD
MSSDRRRRIESLLAEEPDDVFLRYSLALEMEAEGDWEAAIDLLQELARGNPPYVPAYQMAGQHLVKRGRLAEARNALREGIDAAREQGNAHAAAEMSELLMQLGSAGE